MGNLVELVAAEQNVEVKGYSKLFISRLDGSVLCGGKLNGSSSKGVFLPENIVGFTLRAYPEIGMIIQKGKEKKESYFPLGNVEIQGQAQTWIDKVNTLYER